ncbi:MAG TPA: GspE/PulE family protein [Candidatus Sulfotelmatobacter sp.]|nr:GspE/PulE family protein [Candidatus Sulfotelmatobacter sp.]
MEAISHPAALARVPRAFAYKHDALALELSEGILCVGLPEPEDAPLLDALRATTHLPIRAVRMPRETIRHRLRLAYGEPPPSAEPAGDVARLVDRLFGGAIAAHASDVHLEPSRDGGRVRIRVDGVLRELERIDAARFPAVVARVKVLAALDVTERRLPQDGRWAIPYERREIDARVASVPTLDGEQLVVRLLDRHASPPDLDALGMPPALLAGYRAAVAAPWGFIVLAGPTGSGKTTTLYASLTRLDARTRGICSVEDPVEMRLDGVAQVQVNARAGLGFSTVLRAFLRQDPDVVAVGEMRDAETAAVAVSAALAGQTLFTTLHANDAPRAIDRLVELGVNRHALASALTALVGQRLVRTLCERCRVRAPIPAALRAALAERTHWYVAGGCPACEGTGYGGRTGVYELLTVDDDLRDAIAGGASTTAIAHLAARGAYRPLRADALAKVQAGLTSFDELTRVAGWSAPA